ncbi:MAG: acetyl-CoA hydrolase/transferase C-terminal domain-containing protein [Chloroflexota bacterium]|nr:acetyl-CoA hydrolase/transferase C-terminal domain-containing protein [Chloroflexota bacterium]
MDWQDYYRSRLVTAEEAVKVVKSRDRVVFTYGMEPMAIGLALAARKDELQGVKVFVPSPGRDFAWYDPGWEDSFAIEVGYILPLVREMIAEKRGDYVVSGLMWAHEPGARPQPDVVLTQISPPDEHGFCSFGASLWNKKADVRAGKAVVAEVNSSLISTYGDNFIHVSEIDYFVEHTPTGRMPGATDLLGRRTEGPGEVEKNIAGHVSTIIQDGATVQIGVGGTAEWLVQLGIFKERQALGWFSENTPRGVIGLVKEGVITGERKPIHRGKTVATALGGGTKEEMDYIHLNPLFELYGSDYILSPRVICQHENMVAINSALALDLTGQIAAESLGPSMISGSGGQLAFAIGAALSPGGRFITVLTSTARGGTVSRIVPSLKPGTIITVPRTLADYVVTEYGIAHLRGKTQRERAQELIAVAHPDFRAELKKEAQRLYWP